MSLLRRGDAGESVGEIQDILQGWGVPIQDQRGSFGLWTEAAIFVLQRSEGLGVDGIIGADTLTRLRSGQAPACFAGRPCRTMTCVEGVPYLSQRDNFHNPAGTCNVTSLAMALAYHGVTPESPGKQLEDQLFEEIGSPEGLEYFKTSDPDLSRQGFRPNTVFDMLVWVARRHGMDASFSESRTLEEIMGEIDQNRPVVLSGAFTGAGHIVLLIGATATGDLICHDPWGDWMRGYRTSEGDSRIYEKEHVLQILKPAGSAQKWGLFVRKP